MDFLKNAAKIAQEVQGGKKKHGDEESGGLGGLIGGFMGGGEKQKPKPKRDEDEYDDERPSRSKHDDERPHGSKYDDERPHGSKYDDERPHGSKYDDERPHGSQSSGSHGAEHKKKPSAGELFGSAQVLYQAAAGKKVDQGKLAGAASDLLEGLSMYGGLEKTPYADYMKQASTYLDSYGQKHEVAGVQGSVKPSGGHGRPSEVDEDSHPPKPRPSKYDSEESEYGGRPSKPQHKYDSEESEYSDRPQKPRPSKYESEESEYGGHPQKPKPSKYEEEEEYGGHHRPQKSQAPQHEDEEYGSGYSRKPQKSQYEEEVSGPYGGRTQASTYVSAGHGEGRPKPGYNQEEEYGKPKKSWYEE